LSRLGSSAAAAAHKSSAETQTIPLTLPSSSNSGENRLSIVLVNTLPRAAMSSSIGGNSIALPVAKTASR